MSSAGLVCTGLVAWGWPAIALYTGSCHDLALCTVCGNCASAYHHNLSQWAVSHRPQVSPEVHKFGSKGVVVVLIAVPPIFQTHWLDNLSLLAGLTHRP